MLDCPHATSPILLSTLFCCAPPKEALFWIPHPSAAPPACAVSCRKGILGTSSCPLLKHPTFALGPLESWELEEGAGGDPKVRGGEEKGQDGAKPDLP